MLKHLNRFQSKMSQTNVVQRPMCESPEDHVWAHCPRPSPLHSTYSQRNSASLNQYLTHSLLPCTMTSRCEQVLFVCVLTAILPRLSDPRNFITVLLVTREPEQMTLLFWSTACSVTQPTGDSRWCAPLSNLFTPLIFWPLVYLLFVYLVLFMHQAMCNIIWHLRMFI